MVLVLGWGGFGVRKVEGFTVFRVDIVSDSAVTIRSDGKSGDYCIDFSTLGRWEGKHEAHGG